MIDCITVKLANDELTIIANALFEALEYFDIEEAVHPMILAGTMASARLAALLSREQRETLQNSPNPA